MESQNITTTTTKAQELKIDNIEEAKKTMRADLLKFIKTIYPDNNINLYISPISVDNVDYITWEEYNPTGEYGKEKNNYCHPNEVGDYQYPYNEDNIVFELRNCNNYFTEEIKEMLDLNSYITKSFVDVKTDVALEEGVNLELDAGLTEVINEYKRELNKKNEKQKILNSYKNIRQMIKYLENQKIEQSNANEINIINDSIESEKYGYLSRNFYIYTIIALVIIATLIQFSNFVY